VIERPARAMAPNDMMAVTAGPSPPIVTIQPDGSGGAGGTLMSDALSEEASARIAASLANTAGTPFRHPINDREQMIWPQRVCAVACARPRPSLRGLRDNFASRPKCQLVVGRVSCGRPFSRLPDRPRCYR